MVKISPSILAADFANLERDIQRISIADYVHVLSLIHIWEAERRVRKPYQKLTHFPFSPCR